MPGHVASDTEALPLDADATRVLRPYMEARRYPSGALIVRCGDVADSLGLVLQGTLQVWREERGVRAELSTLQPGDWFGTSSLGAGVRTASVSAQTDAEVAFLHPQALMRQLGQGEQPRDPLALLLLTLLCAQNAQLAASTDTVMRAAQEKLRAARVRARAGTAVAVLVSLLSVYAYVADALATAQGRSLELVSLSVAGLASLGAAVYVRQAQLPWSSFGLTTLHLRTALQAALLWSAAFVGVATLIKGAGLLLLPLWSTQPLLLPMALSPGELGWVGAYLLSCLVQEFAARSFLHTAMEQLFEAPYAARRAALLSNLVFSVFHLHYSVLFAAMTFLVGLVYSAYWIRHRSLPGVTVLHAITGLWAMDVLGLFQLPGLPLLP